MEKELTSIIVLAQILNLEHYELTRKAIDSFQKSRDFDKCELIIIDNASVMGGDELSKVANVYVRNRVNVGYPAAINQGVALAKGNLVCLANNDIKVSANWLVVAKEILGRSGTIASVHYKMVGYDEPFDLNNRVWATGKERWCHGSFYTMKKDAFNKIGGYEEDYKEGGMDDWDFQHRLRHIAGYKTAYTNGAAFQHQDSSTYNAHDQDQRAIRDKKNAEIFKKKFGKTHDEIWNERYPEQMKVPWKPFE